MLPNKLFPDGQGSGVQNSVDKNVNNFYKNNTFLCSINQFLTIFVYQTIKNIQL